MIRRPSGIAAPAHSARIYKSGNQALTAFADAVITLGTVEAKTGSYIDTATADKLTVTAPGLYLATFECWFAGGAAGDRTVALKVGATSVRETGITAAGRLSGAATIRLAAGAQVGLNVYTAASTVTIQGAGSKDVGLTLTYLGT